MTTRHTAVLRADESYSICWNLYRAGEMVGLLLPQDLMHLAISHHGNVFGITIACFDF